MLADDHTASRSTPLAAALRLGACLLTVACVGAPQTSTVDPSSADTAQGLDVVPASPTGTVAGVVLTPEGAPIPGLAITLCDEVCRLEETGADGSFLFTAVGTGTPVLEAYGYPGDDPREAVKQYTRFFDFVSTVDGEQRVLDRPRVLYPVASTGPLVGPFTMDVDGLHVEVQTDLLAPPASQLPSFALDVWLGATAIPEHDWPVEGLRGYRIVGAWGLAEWDLHGEAAFQVRADLPIDTPLPPDADVAFLVADYTYGFVEGQFALEAAELSADGMSLHTPAGDGLDRATLWLAAVRITP